MNGQGKERGRVGGERSRRVDTLFDYFLLSTNIYIFRARFFFLRLYIHSYLFRFLLLCSANLSVVKGIIFVVGEISVNAMIISTMFGLRVENVRTDAGRDGQTCLVRPNCANGDRKKYIFPH